MTRQFTTVTYLKYVCFRAREPLHVEAGRSKDSSKSSQPFLLFTLIKTIINLNHFINLIGYNLWTRHLA